MTFSRKPVKDTGYRNLIEKAQWSHDNRRSVFHIEAEDVTLARLYAYAYRSHSIGAFYSCRLALETLAPNTPSENLSRAITILKNIESLAILPVPEDFRALVHTLFTYHNQIGEVRVLLATIPEAAEIARLFGTHMDAITSSNGIRIAKDNVLPEQASFVVPNLGITIVSLIYGDHHSWNSTHLPGNLICATTHRHHEGVEIHLGYSPMHGRTLLGDYCTTIEEGYAMPIPIGLDHGLDNISPDEHWVPFVFGSLTLSGWGVFFDVEPQDRPVESFQEVPLDHSGMNGSRFVERDIARFAAMDKTTRETLIPAEATASGKVGALEMGIARVDPDGLDLTGDRYNIVSVVSGQAEITIGPVSAQLETHDHVGIPARVSANIRQTGSDPLVILDAVIVESPAS